MFGNVLSLAAAATLTVGCVDAPEPGPYEANPASSTLFVLRGVALEGIPYSVNDMGVGSLAIRTSTELTGDKDKDRKSRIGTLATGASLLAICTQEGGSVGKDGDTTTKWLLVAAVGKDFIGGREAPAEGNQTVVGYVTERYVTESFPDEEGVAPLQPCTEAQVGMIQDSLRALAGFPSAPTTTTAS